MDSQFIFFFSALGAFNSTLLSIYFLFFAKPKHVSNLLLGGLLVMLSIRIWKSILFFFNTGLSKTILQIGLSACFLIGPFLYLYVLANLKKELPVKKLITWHLGLQVLLILVVGLLYPYELHADLWGDYFYKIINYQWLLYLLLAGYEARELFVKVVSNTKKLKYQEVWVLSVILGIFLIWLAYFTSSYTSYIVGALSFSFVLYLSVLLIYSKRKKSFISTEKKEKYASNKISSTEADRLLSLLEQVIQEEELYKDPNLTLGSLSKKIQTRPHLVSQFLNDNLQKSFPNFINTYRIEAAKRLLNTEKHLKMEIIAEHCGFNSTSTFYTAFKSVTGTTPAKYAKKIEG